MKKLNKKKYKALISIFIGISFLFCFSQCSMRLEKALEYNREIKKITIKAIPFDDLFFSKVTKKNFTKIFSLKCIVRNEEFIIGDVIDSDSLIISDLLVDNLRMITKINYKGLRYVVISFPQMPEKNIVIGVKNKTYKVDKKFLSWLIQYLPENYKPRWLKIIN